MALNSQMMTKEEVLHAVDDETLMTINAYIFQIKKHKSLNVPDCIINQIIFAYFEDVTMDQYAKWFRVWDNLRTANSLENIPWGDFEIKAIKCNNWVDQGQFNFIANTRIYSWKFRIDKMFKNKESLYFQIFVNERPELNQFQWWPHYDNQHRIKYFDEYDEIIISITCNKEKKNCVANLNVNDWYGGPRYDLAELVLNNHPAAEFTAGWGTHYPSIVVTLLNFRTWSPKHSFVDVE